MVSAICTFVRCARFEVYSPIVRIAEALKGVKAAFEKFYHVWRTWQDAAAKPRQRLPTVLQFPVNDICNSRCQMCQIWRQKKDHELSPDEVFKILSDPLYHDVRGVGINGGEPTLRRDLDALLDAAISALPSLESVSLITNAIRPDRVIETIDGLGGVCRKNDVHLDVMVSVDGVGAVHDRVRGVAGNFDSACRVIDHIVVSPLVGSSRIGCTIIAENVFDVEDVLEFARARGIYARFRLGIPHQRLYAADLKAPFLLTEDAKYHLACFLDTLVCDYERDPMRRAFYRSLRNQIVYGAPRTAGCAWRNHGVTLSSRGDLAFCAVASPTLGDTRERSSEALFWEGQQVLTNIVETKCRDCLHDYDGVGDRRLLLNIWSRKLARRLPVRVLGPLRSIRDSMQRSSERARVRALSRPFGYWGRKGQGQHVRAILLCGWYGTETLGDRAILAGLCGLIHEVMPDWNIDVASLEPFVTRETSRLMPEMRIRKVYDIAGAIAEIQRQSYSVVAIAGGPLMTPVREVIDLARMLSVARRYGISTAVLGCGIGPLAPRGARRAAIADIIQRADFCVVRDTASREVAHRLGRTTPAEVGLDPAFLWMGGVTTSERRPANARPVVALALRDWLLSGYSDSLAGESAREINQRFEGELLELVGYLKDAGAEIIPVCMHTHIIGGDDRAYYRRLFADEPDLFRQVSWRRVLPRDELERLSAVDAVVAMRFHSCVLALALNKPFLALDYTMGGKIPSLLNDTGNMDRLVRIERFEGRKAAERLLSEIATGRVPAPVSTGTVEAAYRSTLRRIRAKVEAANAAIA